MRLCVEKKIDKKSSFAIEFFDLARTQQNVNLMLHFLIPLILLLSTTWCVEHSAISINVFLLSIIMLKRFFLFLLFLSFFSSLLAVFAASFAYLLIKRERTQCLRHRLWIIISFSSPSWEKENHVILTIF